MLQSWSWRLVSLGLPVVLGLVSAVNAWAQESSPAPSVAMIRQAFEPAVACTHEKYERDPAAMQTLMKLVSQMEQQQRAAAGRGGSDGRLPWPVPALGQVFDTVWWTAYGTISWSRRAKPEDLLRMVRAQGFQLLPETTKPSGPLPPGAKVWILERPSPSHGAHIQLIGGQLDFSAGRGVLTAPSQGTTLICSLQPVRGQQEHSPADGPSLRSVNEAVMSGKPQAATWVDEVLRTGRLDLLHAVARYRWLTPEQVARLLESPSNSVASALIANTHVPLSVDQLQMLSQRDEGRLGMALIESRYAALPPLLRSPLCERTDLHRWCVLREGGPEAMALWRTIVQSDDQSQIQGSERFLTPLSPQSIDIMLEHGSDRTRTRVSMELRPPLTPAHIERMLNDSVADVQIGVLRRRDEVKITREQYDRGVNHADTRLAFWYRQRQEHVPNGAQIEAGLTSPDVPTRRGWALDHRFVLTSAQAARGLADPDLRVTFMQRPDVRMTEQQLDTCTRAPDVSTRFVCVARPDYKLTTQRFTWMLQDTNGNVLRSHFKSHPPQPLVLAPLLKDMRRSLDECALNELISRLCQRQPEACRVLNLKTP